MDQRIESFLSDVLALRHALGDLLDGWRTPRAPRLNWQFWVGVDAAGHTGFVA